MAAVSAGKAESAAERRLRLPAISNPPRQIDSAWARNLLTSRQRSMDTPESLPVVSPCVTDGRRILYRHNSLVLKSEAPECGAPKNTDQREHVSGRKIQSDKPIHTSGFKDVI